MAQKPPRGRDALQVTADAIDVRAGIDLSQLFNQLINEANRLVPDLAQRGLKGQALADAVMAALDGLFEATFVRQGREATHEALSLGRNVAAQSMLGEIEVAVRSAVLDSPRICTNCVALDGATAKVNGPVVFIKPEGAALLRENGIDPGSDTAYFAIMPPNFCKGEELCKCVLYFRAQEKAA